MMKKLIFILTFFYANFSFAQNVAISDEISIRTDKGYDVMGKFGDRYLLFRDKTYEFEIQAYDENMRFSWNREINLDKRRAEIINLTYSKDDFTVFYKTKYKGDYIVKANKYDTKANLIDSITVKNFGNGYFYPPIFQSTYSEDKNIMLIYFSSQNDSYELCAFDVNRMKTLWHNKVVPPDTDIDNDFRKIHVDNLGNAYLFFERNNNEHSLSSRVHTMDIYFLGSNWDGIKPVIIPLKDFITYDAKFEIDNLNKQVAIVGLYSEKNRGRANGWFLIKMPSFSPENLTFHTQPFEEDLMNTALTNNKKGNPTNFKGIEEISIQDIVFRVDGGVVVLSEKNRRYERATGMRTPGAFYTGSFGMGGARLAVDYYYEDLLILSINPDGTSQWKCILHKKQYSQDDWAIFSSYFIVKTPENLRLVFNDEINTNTTVSEYVLDADGEFDRNSIFNTERQNIQLRMKASAQIAANEVIIPSQYRDKLRLLRLKYE